MQLSEARVPDLIEALNDESPEVRRTAAERLGELRAPEAVEPLIGLLASHLWCPS